MKKCCFIVPYFGKLPDYFEIFIKTCSKNKDYNWLIITDSLNKYTKYDNIKFINMDFEDFKRLVQSKFDFKINLETPYKLCDYKPAYGYILQEYVPTHEFMFWGHCDIDTIIGNIGNFISEDMLKTYDKIFCLGHMILYKNTLENNKVFMKKLNNIELYRDVFTTSKICWFDETYNGRNNINSIFIQNGKKVYTDDLSLNFKIFPTKFIKTTYNFEKDTFEDEKYRNALYVWDNGSILRYYIKDKKVVREEYLYMHFQQRKMKCKSLNLECKSFKIIPNKFLKLKYSEINIKNIKWIRKHCLCFHTIKTKIKWKKNSIIKKIIKK